jgi:hypothetical protein
VNEAEELLNISKTPRLFKLLHLADLLPSTTVDRGGERRRRRRRRLYRCQMIHHRSRCTD